MATLLKANGEKVTVSPKNRRDFQLKELQDYVKGFVQFVYCGDKLLVINENGKSDGNELNIEATKIALRHRAIMMDDYIVGDALFCRANEVK